MKQRIINILSALFQAIDTLLCRLHIKHPKVVIFMDGGICSQMLMYIQGQYYAEYNFDVRYDTLWYQLHGRDNMGIMPRTFEFTEMWPNLPFKTLNKWQRKWYLLFFKAKRTNGDMLPEPQTVRHSMYFDGWWDLAPDLSKSLFEKHYDLRSAASPHDIQKEESQKFDNVVGVHVRRGDLAKGDNPFYGGVTDGYFERAIEFCNKQFNPKKYLFFSDEPDWVEQNICPQINQPYEIKRGNKAWEDFWLLAHCSVIVASQGSFGKMAAQLNPQAVLIQCDNKHANRKRPNSYFVK